MTEFQMYWLVMLDSIHSLLFGLLIPSAIAFGLSTVVGIIFLSCGKHNPHFSYSGEPHDPKCEGCDRVGKFLLKISRSTFFLLLALSLSHSFLPSTKQMAAIIIVPKLCRAIDGNEKIKQMPAKLVDLADKWIEELQPQKSEVPGDAGK